MRTARANRYLLSERRTMPNQLLHKPHLDGKIIFEFRSEGDVIDAPGIHTG